jgi:hypothetical protein
MSYSSYVMLIATLLFCFTAHTVISQEIKRCVTDEGEAILLKDADYVKIRADIENFTANFCAQKRDEKGNSILYHQTFVIPVVVHIVYKNASENLPDARIISNINSINEDYRRMPQTQGFNTHQAGVDTRLEFRLADTDPNGQPTNGITRTQTNVQRFFLTNAIKRTADGGIDPWNSAEYLNIWVGDLWLIRGGLERDELLGYAQFPGGAANTDGVAIDFTVFGDNINTVPPFHLGRTAPHEIGHYLNLFHTFTDVCTNQNCQTQGDRCCDTPPVQNATSGCPNGRQSCGFATQIENYMDYTDDVCMNLFTEDQSDRMDATLAGVRVNLPNPTMSTDFRVFGVHEGNYDYNETTDIVALGTGQYDDMIIPSGNTVSMRSRTGVIFQDGFEARYGSNMRAFVDNGLPAFGRKSDHFERIANQYETDDTGDSQMISIIPNPATDEIQIIGRFTASFELFSSIGISVMTIEKGKRKVDVSMLTSGIYYARIPTMSGIAVKSFVIIR